MKAGGELSGLEGGMGDLERHMTGQGNTSVQLTGA